MGAWGSCSELQGVKARENPAKRNSPADVLVSGTQIIHSSPVSPHSQMTHTCEHTKTSTFLGMGMKSTFHTITILGLHQEPHQFSVEDVASMVVTLMAVPMATRKMMDVLLVAMVMVQMADLYQATQNLQNGKPEMWWKSHGVLRQITEVATSTAFARTTSLFQRWWLLLRNAFSKHLFASSVIHPGHSSERRRAQGANSKQIVHLLAPCPQTHSGQRIRSQLVLDLVVDLEATNTFPGTDIAREATSSPHQLQVSLAFGGLILFSSRVVRSSALLIRCRFPVICQLVTTCCPCALIVSRQPRSGTPAQIFIFLSTLRMFWCS